MKKFITLIASILVLSVSLFSCRGKNPVSPVLKKSGFDSPEEYLENPSVKQAINSSGIPVNKGDNPPRLAGTYNVIGKITDASSLLRDFVGTDFNSKITLYNQTASGKISFKEEAQGIIVWATGGYITGQNGVFTIWQESKQTGDEAGLPDDITIYVSLLISGTKHENGNLSAKGISIITKVVSNNENYDIDEIEGVWWMHNSTCYLQVGEALAIATTNQNLPLNAIISSLIN